MWWSNSLCAMEMLFNVQFVKGIDLECILDGDAYF